MPTSSGDIPTHNETSALPARRGQDQTTKTERSRRRRRDNQLDSDLPAWKRKNTPGRNSYLKVILDDEAMDKMFAITKEIKDDFEAHQLKKVNLSQNSNETEETEPKRKRPLKLKLRSPSSLHMTFFFGGEVLCELSEQELLDWHTNISERFRQSGFVTSKQGEGTAQASGSKDNDYWFRFHEFCVFPSRRNNLIVAVLDVSPSMEKLHDDIRMIGKSSSSEGIREITKRSKQKWTAHVTLANIQAGKAQVNDLKAFLKDRSATIALDDTDKWGSHLSVEGFAMGGPIPKQFDLEWRFKKA